MTPSRPNPSLIRVPTRKDGRGLDRYEALASLAHRPDHDRLVHVGSSNGFHVFRVGEKPADPFARADKLGLADVATRQRVRRSRSQH